MASKRCPEDGGDGPQIKRARFKPRESAAGISQYMAGNKRPAFTARMKSRSFDFIVKEIDLAGEVVQLTTLENPVTADDTGTKGIDQQLKDRLEEMMANEDIKATVSVDVGSMTKEQRTLVHVSLRNGYPSLQSETKDDDGKRFIVISKKSAHKGERLRYYWPTGRPNHTTFVLYKDNTDTMEAINAIAGLTRTKPSVFSYAGTKDKRAITTQRVSVYRMKPDYLLGINKRNEKFKIGNVHFAQKQIQLGELTGNRFIITLRDVKGGTQEEMRAALENLRKGFINYFGLQRFGTTSIPTHDIGKKMLASKWAEACDLILRPRDGGRPRRDLDAARALWMGTKDASKCYDLLTTRGSQTSLEGHLLAALKKDPGNFQSALFGLQKNTRLLYIHAYQSFIWNSVVSRRLEMFGAKVVLGDLVLPPDSKEDGDRAPVEYVTAENITRFTIWDVVLPLPGFSIKYPDNEQAGWFIDIVKSDGFENLDCFSSNNKSFAMRGTYRKVYCLPKDLDFEIKSYTNPNEPLVETDWDALLKKDEKLRELETRKIQVKQDRREKERAAQLKNGEEIYERKKPAPPADGKVDSEEKIGVVLSFSLPAASYATMLLREFLSSDEEMEGEEEKTSVEKEAGCPVEDEEVDDEDVVDAC
ncbi:pseudouridylate synthase 7 homolog [Galendromus occidentalis]|uniref:Pseudouridylate synthase 7 homolog n=1 Tax=Galendromus occidentalis TaxID=34638 RepID=A0AAJ6QUX7_9ACAR|nr:pseudouridylate synthase 7 homolog [Galendromus occidentalis]